MSGSGALLAAATLAALTLLGCGERDRTTTSTATADEARGGGVRLEKLADFDQPLYVTQPPTGDEALYVVEQCGRIQRVDPDGAAETYLDVGNKVTCGGEQGLLSLAFAPDYERSGLLYVNYTDTEGDSVTAEYARSSSDPEMADPGSAREVLRIEDPYPNHNGGLLLFGPDGKLYLGMGDGGSAGDPDRTAQDLSTLLGKLIRIDPTPRGSDPYGIPADNPFAHQAGARPEILAYGLRNPWRFSFDRDTDALWIGDVGQDTFEEIDAVEFEELASGLNFGWSAFEGTRRFNDDQQAPDAVPPAHEYGREAGCSVTGGYVVRDRELADLEGRYVYGDFCQGQLRSFTARPGEEATDDRAAGLHVPGLSSFGEDAQGHLYVTSLEGPVYRLVADE